MPTNIMHNMTTPTSKDTPFGVQKTAKIIQFYTQRYHHKVQLLQDNSLESGEGWHLLRTDDLWTHADKTNVLSVSMVISRTSSWHKIHFSPTGEEAWFRRDGMLIAEIDTRSSVSSAFLDIMIVLSLYVQRVTYTLIS